ncbi:MAG: hypothetical protein R2757_09095 [Draconibacterium sp.]
MITLAFIFAGTNNVFAQNTVSPGITSTTPITPLACIASSEPLHPFPGVPYVYSLNGTAGEEQADDYTWWATKDVNFLTAPGTTNMSVTTDVQEMEQELYITSDVVGDYNNPAGTDLTIELSWNSFDGTVHEVLLVVYTLDETGCTDNVQAWRIIPQYNFTLDIAGILDDGTDGAAECVSPVQTATYDGTNLNMDYGQNYVFFAVNAANWTTSWVPSISDGSTTTYGATIVGYEWAYPDQASGVGSVWNAPNTPVLASHYASATSGFIGAAGECIIVKVELDHDNYELHGTDEIVSLAINGDMWNTATSAHDGTYPDLDDNDSACNGDSTDEAEYTIESRPTITDTTPNPFVTKN